MSEAFKCDVSGQLVEGKPEAAFLVELTGEAALLCYPQRKRDERSYVPGSISPAVQAKIKAAIRAIEW